MAKLQRTFDTTAVFHSISIIVLAVAILKMAKPVMIPVALGILLTFILTPAVVRLEKWRVPRIPAVLTVALVAFGLLFGVIWTTASQIHSLAGELPNHRAEIQAKLELLKSDKGSVFSRLGRMFDELSTGFAAGEVDSADPGPVPSDPVPPPADGGGERNPAPSTVVVVEARPPLEVLVNSVAPILEPLATGCVVVVMVLFFLIKREDVRIRLFSLWGESSLAGTTQLLGDASERVSRYLVCLLMVNAAFGLWFGAGLYLIGVPYAVLWGFLTLALRFVPYLGSPASVLFPLMISIATSNGWGEPLAVVLFFGISELFVGNVVEPILFGRSTGLSPVALLLAVMFWAWIWGAVGLLLSTPLTICLVVLGQHIPALRWLKVLLAENPEMDTSLQYYQRLLAQDSADAGNLLARQVSDLGAARAFDSVVVPALRKAKDSLEQGEIDLAEADFIFASTGKLIGEMPLVTGDTDGKGKAEPERNGDRPGDDPDDGGQLEKDGEDPATRRPIFGFPAHHPADELALAMLQRTLPESHSMVLIPVQSLPSVALAEIERQKPLAAVVTVVPPGGFPQVVYFCEECIRRSPTTVVVVAVLGEVRHYDRVLVELRRLGVDFVAASLEETAKQLVALGSGTDEPRRPAVSRPIGTGSPIRDRSTGWSDFPAPDGLPALREPDRRDGLVLNPP